jgi:hypothetical protein
MTVIENFAALSEQEQRAFAEALVKTINSESTFTSDVDFRILEIEANDLTGALEIFVETIDALDVARAATWLQYDEDEIHRRPDYDTDIEYEDSIESDILEALKTTSVELEGYKISVKLEDYDKVEEIAEFEVDDYSHSEDGIGWYEYQGRDYYDSHDVYEIDGTITSTISVGLTFIVEPIDAVSGENELESEEN